MESGDQVDKDTDNQFKIADENTEIPKVEFKVKAPRPIEEQLNELKLLIEVQKRKIGQLTEGTPFAQIGAPDFNVLDKIDEEIKENPFWENYRVFSPIIFCYATDVDTKVTEARDAIVTGQILKTLSVLNILGNRISSGNHTEFDLFEYTHASKVLEEKIDICEALKAPSGDSKAMRIRIKGTDKVLRVDVKKFHKAL